MVSKPLAPVHDYGRSNRSVRLVGGFRELTSDQLSSTALAIVVIVVFIALAIPFLGVPSPYLQSTDAYSPPTTKHLLGTDQLGRETLSGVLWGTQVSLAFGVVVAILSGLTGMLMGALSAYYGGALDDLFSRLIEVFVAVPPLFVIILVVSLFGANLLFTMFVVGLLVWPANARIMRAQVLSIRQREFVIAEVVVGASRRRILLRHVIPNSIAPLVANATIQIGFAIGLEAGLSFLGFGDPNVVSWGQMLYVAQTQYATAWWTALFPGICVSATVLGFNVLGDSIGRLLNPALRR